MRGDMGANDIQKHNNDVARLVILCKFQVVTVLCFKRLFMYVCVAYVCV